MENLMRLCTKTIRVSYCDPDATDSSSDDESDKFQKKSKRKVIEGEVEFVEKIQNEGTGFKKPNLTSEGEKMVGIRKMKSGKFWAEIRDPIKKRWVWLGIFGTAEAASRAYLAEESKIAAAELRAKKTIPKTAGNKIVGVRMRKSGKFSAEIRNPITKRRVWLGTFDTEEEASRSYLAKKAHFEAEKLKAKRRLDRVGSEKSSAPDSVSSDLSNENVGENKVSRDQEAEFGVFNGVQVVDKNGFLVGEFSMLDDLSIFSVEEDANS